MRKGWILGLALIVLMTSGCVFGNKKKEAEKEQIRLNMEAYLERTYDKDFTVDKPRIKGNESMGYNSWGAYAYTVEQEPLKFAVEWIIGEPGKFNDSYLRYFWSRDGLREIQPIIKAEIGENTLIDFDFSFLGPLYDELYPELKNMSYQQVLAKYQDKVAFDINIYTFRNKDINKNDEAEKIFNIYTKAVENRSLRKVGIGVSYMNPLYKAEFLKIFDAKAWHLLDRDEAKKEGYLYNEVVFRVENTKGISATEIEDLFQY